jgi:hypothetical protein
LAFGGQVFDEFDGGHLGGFGEVVEFVIGKVELAAEATAYVEDGAGIGEGACWPMDLGAFDR